MKVIGIDPGTANCGYGIVHESGGRLRAIGHGSWSTPAAERLELRLWTIFGAIPAVLAHMLSPEDLGLLEISLAFFGVATLFMELGLPFLVWNRHMRWFMVSGAILFHTLIVRDGMLLRMVPWNVRPREAVRVYEEARHEILNETNRADVIDDLLQWLQRVSTRFAARMNP